MKKLFMLSLVVALAASFLVVSCNKDLTSTLSTPDGIKLVSTAVQKPIQTFAELNAAVKVEDGVLVFNTLKDLERTTNFLRDTSMPRNAKKEEIAKWEASIPSFTSVYKYYERAIQDLMIDSLNPHAIDVVKAKYGNKLHYLNDDMIEPLINNGTVHGRIIGEKGMYKVENSIVQYYKDAVISIPDGDLAKLDLAKQTLQTDTSKGIHVHDLVIGKNVANQLQLRGRIIPTCSNSAWTFDEPTAILAAHGETFRLTGRFDIIDNGIIAGHIFSRIVDVGVRINIYQQRQRWWGGWSSSYAYGGFNWGFGWGFDLDLIAPDGFNGFAPPRTCCDEGIGRPAGGQGWYQGSELNYYLGIWYVNNDTDVPDFQQFAFRYGTQRFCVRREGLRAESDIVDKDGNRLTIDQYSQN